MAVDGSAQPNSIESRDSLPRRPREMKRHPGVLNRPGGTPYAALSHRPCALDEQLVDMEPSQRRPLIGHLMIADFT